MKKSPFTRLLSKVNIPPYRDDVITSSADLVPTMRMKNFNVNLPQTLDVLVQDNRLLATNGWLSKDGTLYACRWRQHKNITLALDMLNEAEMERSGYIKLTNMKWLVEDRYCDTNITPEQINTIKSWYELNDLPKSSFELLQKNWC